MADGVRDVPSSGNCGGGTGVDCMGAVRHLWDCLDGELTEARLTEVRAHFERCTACYPHFDFERQFLVALAATRPECQAPEQLRDRVVRALRAAGCTHCE
jgi:anti-sigma factor (TIGR02949 family)